MDEAAETELDARGRAFWDAVAPILDGTSTPPLGGPCPHSPPPAVGYLGDVIIRNRAILPHYIRDTDSALAAAHGAWQREGREPRPPEAQKLREVVDGSFWQHVETMIVTTEHTAAVVSPGETAYEPGLLKGWIFSWDYDAGRIVCAGPVEATNSDHVIKTDGGWEMPLRDDLWSNAVEADAAALRAAE